MFFGTLHLPPVRYGGGLSVSLRRAIGLFAVASLAFGGTFVAARAGQVYIPPLLFVAIRFDLAAILLLGYAAYATEGSIRPRTRGDIGGVLAAGVLTIGLANGLLFVGQGYVTSAVGAILFSLVPIIAPLFAALLLSDERVSALGAVGMGVAAIGVGMVVGVSPSNLLAESGVGAALVLGGAASAALGTVLTRRCEATISSTAQVAWGLPISAVLLHGMSLAVGESAATIEWTLAAIVSLAYVTVVAGAVGYIAYFALIEEVGALRSSLIFYASPLVAALGGWWFLGEAITTTTVAGFVTVVAGFLVIGHEQFRAAFRRLADGRGQATGGYEPSD